MPEIRMPDAECRYSYVIMLVAAAAVDAQRNGVNLQRCQLAEVFALLAAKKNNIRTRRTTFDAL